MDRRTTVASSASRSRRLSFQRQHLMTQLSVSMLLITLGALSGRADDKTELYRKQIEAAWPGLGKRLEMDKLNLAECRQVRDLTPLKDIPLTSLILKNCGEVRDLTPLKGMRLTTLRLEGCGIRDLTPLQGMPLTEVTLTPKHITKGMDILRELKSLKTIGTGGDAKDKFPAEEFWKRYDKGEFK
jgi:hypothetical protein